VSVIDKYFKYSIGKKQVMGIVGLALCAFAFVHMTGNFLVFRSAEAFNQYGEFLHHLPAFWVVEIGLAATFLIHIVLGITLALENRRARPQNYAVKKSSGGASIGSSTMAYTGTYFVLFLILHYLNIRFALLPKPVPGATEYDVTAAVLANPGWAIFYVVSALILGLHLSHGMQSSFQSLGFYDRKTTPVLKQLSILYGIAIALGNSAIALFMLAKHG
jgi:succinate dehydrogenase / fumarate reductase cytochrome b subunit